MRRPLSGAGLIFILVLLILQLLIPASPLLIEDIGSDRVCISGTLDRIEYKISDDQKTEVWYIKDPHMNGRQMCASDHATAMCYMAEGTRKSLLGASVTIRGSAKTFSAPTNPGEFDSERYYRTVRVAFKVFEGELCEYDPGAVTAGYRIANRLSRIRNDVGMLCEFCFDEDDAAIIKSIVLGDKSQVDADVKSMYSRNGIAHILAISGLHVSILGMGMAALMKKCGMGTVPRCAIVITLMVLYGFMTGMAASAARAIIMFSLKMAADIFRRTYDAVTALVIAAMMLLSTNPSYLFHSGFQFSFGAVCAVFMVLPILEDVFPKPVAAGLGINVVTLPVYLHNYFYFPILSIILNLYIIPLMSVLLCVSLIAVAGCLINVTLGKVLAFPAHLILLIYEYSCRICDRLPVNRLVFGKPAAACIAAYTILVLLILIFRKYQTRLQVMMHLLFACMILTVRIRPCVSVTTIDVGQGDGIYITDNHGGDILIDCGSSSVNEVGRYRLFPFLYSQGVSSLDGVFITHLDADHYNGILELVEDGGTSSPRIDCLYMTSAEQASDSETYREIIGAAAGNGIPVRIISQGDVFRAGSLCLECLYPDSGCRGEDTNDESLVMHLKHGNVHMLFTGDLGGEGEIDLDGVLPSYVNQEDILVLKVAHHGSKYSSYDEFLDLSGPDIALISAGKNNRYGHPHEELTDRLDVRGIPRFNTAELGAVRVDISRDEVKVSGFVDSDNKK